MISRFDHAVIAVPDIPAALSAFAALGFDVAAGGRHPSIGTQNAIVRFGLDYLELLAVEDVAQARSSGPFGAELADYLGHASGLVGFVLASSDLDQEAAGLGTIDQAAVGPFAMDRERPDGRCLAWRLVIPGGSPWRKPWPFLIEWETPDSERLAWDAPGEHANGACGVAGVELLVADLSAARRLYEQGLGMQADSATPAAVSYVLGAFTLRVSEPQNAEQTRELAEQGPGPYRLLLRSRDVDVWHDSPLATRNDERVDIEPAAALGARISFVAS